MEKQEKPSPSYACDTPFETGGALCKVCRLLPESPQGRRCSRLVAVSPAMKALLQRAATVAGTDASVVMRGESGSGKEVVARALHANSPRRLKPFVAVNCAALPPELLESEFFGHVRGAFTGAQTARRGLFEAANGGTLFLDEIAEMPLPQWLTWDVKKMQGGVAGMPTTESAQPAGDLISVLSFYSR